VRPLSSLAELAHRGAVGNMPSSTFGVGGRCDEVGTGVGEVSSSCVGVAARAPSVPTISSAALRKRAWSRKGNTASLMGRKMAASPVCQVGKKGECHENGAPRRGREDRGGSRLMTTNGGNVNPPTKARHQKKSTKSARFNCRDNGT